MKKLRTLLTMVAALAMLMIGMVIPVSADATTELVSMKVYAVNAAGEKTEVPMDFSQTTYTYDLTVMSDVTEIQIEASPADGTSTWAIVKDGINTKMDFGTNKTEVTVTSAAGAVNTYTLNTTKLTAEEQATYQADEGKTSEDSTSEKKSSGTTVKVGKQKLKISTTFDENVIPEGFKKATAKYKGKKYPCIKGEIKSLTAFYLYNDDREGFYIYNADTKKFYAMNNIQIKSRMYTIVQPEETDKVLNNYEQKTVTVIDQEVKTWVLNEEEGLYLVYAMNWDGETSLYAYDDNEKCMQRYIISDDVYSQVEAANKAYNNLQDKYNKLVDKYNLLLKILCGMAVVIIVLIFAVINLALNRKEKRLRREEAAYNAYDDEEEDTEQADEKENTQEDVTEDTVAETEETVSEDAAEETAQTDEPVAENDAPAEEAQDIAQPAEDAVDITAPGEAVVSDLAELFDDIAEPEETVETAEEVVIAEPAEEIAVADAAAVVNAVKAETAAVAQAEAQEKIETASSDAQKESEEDLKETLKSMLPDEDGDDDFEFIDLD